MVSVVLRHQVEHYRGNKNRLQRSRRLNVYIFWPVFQVEDFVDPNGKIYLQREETPSNR